MRRTAVSIAASFVASTIIAPSLEAPSQRIAVGSEIVRGSRIEPYRNRFDQHVRFADGTEAHSRVEWTDTLERLNFRGHQFFQRRITTFRMHDGAAIADGGAIFDAATLAPRSSSEYQSDREYWSAEFRNGGREMAAIVSRPAEAGGPRLINWSVQQAAFDTYNATFGLLLAAMPLGPGFSVTYPAVADDKASVRMQTATVVGSEPFTSPRGTRDTWVVEVINEGESMAATFWISPLPPYVLRHRATVMLNGRPAVFTWTSLEG